MSLITQKIVLALATFLGPAGLGIAVAHLAWEPDREPSETSKAASPVEAQRLSPFAALPEPPLAEELAFSGVVREVVPAGSYVYLAVTSESGAPRWIATHAKGSLPAGSTVEVRSFAARNEFESPRLGRTFDRLLFGIVTRRNVL